MRPLLATAFLMAAPAAPVWAQGWGPGSMHDWGMGRGNGAGPLLFLALLALLTALIVVSVGWLGTGKPGARTRTARDIFDERYARGDIEREEYMRRRQDITGEHLYDVRDDP